MSPKASTSPAAWRAAVKQRALQKQVAQAEKHIPHEEPEEAMQAGARRYRKPPFPKQHQAKPGRQARLDPLPMYDAPYYLGSEKLRYRVRL